MNILKLHCTIAAPSPVADVATCEEDVLPTVKRAARGRKRVPSPPSSTSLPPSSVATAKKVVLIAFCVLESELTNPENRELDSNSDQI